MTVRINEGANKPREKFFVEIDLRNRHAEKVSRPSPVQLIQPTRVKICPVVRQWKKNVKKRETFGFSSRLTSLV